MESKIKIDRIIEEKKRGEWSSRVDGYREYPSRPETGGHARLASHRKTQTLKAKVLETKGSPQEPKNPRRNKQTRGKQRKIEETGKESASSETTRAVTMVLHTCMMHERF